MNSMADWLAVFCQGGPVMVLILFCSFAVVTIGIERHLFYRGMKTDVNKLIQALTPSLDARDWETALSVCAERGGAPAMLAAAGIQCLQLGITQIESVLEGEASLIAARLRENLNHLDMIVTVSPLLGLLGTVIGMIGSFSVLNVKSGQPLAITGGVGEALIATAAGLLVALLALVVHSVFSHRFDRRITELEQICILLVRCAKRESLHETA